MKSRILSAAELGDPNLAIECKKTRLIFAVVGFFVAVLLASIDPAAHNGQSAGIMVGSVIFCPPVLLSIPLFVVAFEASEYGSVLYFAIWALVGLLNAGLYAAVGPPIIRAIRKNWDFTHK